MKKRMLSNWLEVPGFLGFQQRQSGSQFKQYMI